MESTSRARVVSGRGKALRALSDADIIALLYRRVSKVEQADEGVSLPRQATEGRRYIRAHQQWIAGAEYQDVESGRKDDRPDYQALLLEARRLVLSGKRVVIVVASLDRLGRNVRERVRAYEELVHELGCEIHSIREGGLVSELMYNLLASFAQEESRKLSERVRSAWSHFADGGWWKPGNPAWGYALVPASDEQRQHGAPLSVLVPHDVEAAYVREAWGRLAQGESMRQIAIWVAGLPAVARGGRNLGYAAVRQMFRAPVYVGRLGTFDDAEPGSVLERPRGRWEQLVDDATWERAILERALGSKMPRQASGRYRLTGLLYCYRCGARMSGRHKPAQSGYAKTDRYEYICNSSKTLGVTLAAKRCAATVSAPLLEEDVLGRVCQVLEYASRADGRRDLTVAWDALNRDARADSAGGRIVALEAQQTKIRARIDASYDRLIDGVIEKPEYDRNRLRYQEELEAVDAELVRLRGLVQPRVAPMDLEPLLGSLGAWAAGLASDDLPLVRKSLGTLLERVTPKKHGRGRYTAQLEWTPIGLWLLSVAARACLDLVPEYDRAKARYLTGTQSLDAGVA